MSILEVDCKDIENNPECPHGPTLLFTRLIKGKKDQFYGCSAYRDRKGCPFFLRRGEKITESKRLVWKEMKDNFPRIEPEIYRKSFLNALEKGENDRTFCEECGMFVSDISAHATHKLAKKISDKNMSNPFSIIDAIQDNKKEAQFWFEGSSRNFIVESIKNYDKILCVGCPTVHEELLQKSLLLDLDYRYYSFYDQNEFIWFNMMNFHFMQKNGHEILKRFMSDNTMVVIDPPFGARLEPISYLISKLKNISQNTSFILILPYFMEPQVVKHLPGFEMLDFAIEYSNHSKMKNRNKSSPVRIFTDADPKKFKMPPHAYWFCDICQRWRSNGNKHCDLCKTCTSKNGESYLHCPLCDKCVKHTWAHCILCNMCTYPENHSCKKQDKNVEKKSKKIKR